ncbi:type I restriction enzyme HsdR N-terminal domain-containing protein [Bacillus tianshenii]|uniref:type I restriction endonuclease n=1 Tax=Sutcliffiella tianshenii TaxID=1463404 RepID=UPI001CD3535E|nr:type I restriction endonuclease [Bacillus tianshenii]MCA1318392.1 type I restriction enzyme HsdR N-terminal domain-containing protein [Bacillus tianshenii]
MEDFKQQIRNLATRIHRVKDSIHTEEATKTSLIMPMLQILGYDIFNPEELVPEFVADVGIKKGEKIDYAIMRENEPVILIEAKCVNEALTKHDSQLFRYFGTTKAKFAILTNGIEYKFFTDLEEQNKMDQKPFFTINMLDLKEIEILELAKFRKQDFDVVNVLTTASELKYTGEIKHYLSQQWEDPSEEFVKVVINDIYSGVKTKKVIDNFRDLVKKSLSQYVNEKVNEKLQNALNSSTEATTPNIKASIETEKEKLSPEENTSQEEAIVTTEEEIEGYVIVKIILREAIDPSRIFYRDNKSYFNVLLDDNIRRWICRLGFNSNQKYIQINDAGRTTYKIDHVNDILTYKEELLAVARTFDFVANK